MANTVDLSLVTTANTFDQWRIQTNLSANDVNEIARGDFTKPTGNVTLTVGRIVLSNALGTTLTVTANGSIGGKLTVKDIDQTGAGRFDSEAGVINFANAASTIHANGNVRTRFLYNNTFFSAANINATGFIETTGASNNANLIMNVGGVLTVRTAANGANVYVTSNLHVANIATIGNARITLANATTANIITGNVATLNVNATGAVANIANANIANLATANVIATAARATSLNATTGNISTLHVTTLTVTDPISAPAEQASESYRLRVGLSSRGVGTFGVFQGTSNGNSSIRFNTTGNVWQTTANDIEGTFSTILNTANIGSTYATDTANVASLTLVKGANDNALAAFASSNNAANTVRVSQNSGSTIAKANGLNFVNTATVLCTVAAGVNGNANVSFVTTAATQGATGAQGTAGFVGSDGAQGATGAQGVAGTQGAVGANGSNGAQGATGAGTQGATGAQGITGSTGSTGSTGAQGAAGANGSNGAQGAAGANGSNGAQGITGSTGSTGSTGAQGPAGPATALNATSTTGTWYPVGVTSIGSSTTPRAYSTFYFSSGTIVATDFSASSDLRLKNVIGYVDGAVEIVEQLNGIKYQWNDLALSLGKENTKPQEIGVIAQEVAEVIPEAIYTDANGYLNVSYDRIVPVLIEAIKELNARIKVLEGK